MKKFLDFFAGWFDAMARAKAATVLTRMGKVEEAKSLYK